MPALDWQDELWPDNGDRLFKKILPIPSTTYSHPLKKSRHRRSNLKSGGKVFPTPATPDLISKRDTYV
jgi:hypothetical protein